MLVEKILARPFENLNTQAAQRLVEELEEVRWALTTVQALAEADDGGLLSQRFFKWRGLVDERRARMATLYPDAQAHRTAADDQQKPQQLGQWIDLG